MPTVKDVWKTVETLMPFLGEKTVVVSLACLAYPLCKESVNDLP